MATKGKRPESLADEDRRAEQFTRDLMANGPHRSIRPSNIIFSTTQDPNATYICSCGLVCKVGNPCQHDQTTSQDK